ncbi:hypothetical protein SAMN05421788_106192 [Filimonas lacunae]|uniref:Uncharacterized protein n=1 Tax=Filimonas lacunae TaxID=477680 RepID=A0A173MEV8_9BACT|nr:hypothetical protein [Filimonas lacunae]BAV06132.1 hypothetical protein FLA_2147 [Filimonas lacunae]SIT24802.1 hypothetical protein SAMN05421788_106192 [Filimonas lacunae]
MTPASELIKQYIADETAGLSKLQKFFGATPKVIDTHDMVAASFKPPPNNETVIKPSASNKIFSVFIILFLLFWASSISKTLLAQKIPLPIGLILITLAAIFIFVVLKYSAFNEKLWYSITLTPTDIALGQSHILWKDIAATAIMSQTEGKNTESYLLLFLHDDTVEKLDLAKFNTSAKQLSAAIEYYKNTQPAIV